MGKTSRIRSILVSALVVETLCVTYALYIPSATAVLSILHPLAGLVIAGCLLWMGPYDSSGSMVRNTVNVINRYRWLLFGVAGFVICRLAMQTMIDEPIDYHSADMLPIIKVMNQRFWSGNWSQVYDPIPEIWSGVKPIYLPAMWMPFALPQAMNIDIRWLTVVLLLITLAIVLWSLDLSAKRSWLVFLCGMILFWWLFADENAGLFSFTEEGIIVFYYALLTVALLKNKGWMIAICASLCVFSRYALIGWLPAMVIYFVYRKEWKNLLRFAVSGIVFFIVLLVLPFGGRVIHDLLMLPGEYVAFTARVWHDAQHIFSEGLGVAKFFGASRIAELHYLLIALSLSTPSIVMVVLLYWGKKRNIQQQNLPLVVLKLALVIFFTFIDVPYMYLFYTSSFVSLIAVAVFLRRPEVR